MTHLIIYEFSITLQVQIWDLKNQLWAVNDSAYMAEYISRKEIINPLYTIKNHSTEGFAMDWSPCKPGQLASGDNDGKIFVTQAKVRTCTQNID